MTAFRSIKSRSDLADYLNIPPSKITYILFKRGVDSYYTEFEIKEENSQLEKLYVLARRAVDEENYKNAADQLLPTA